MRTNDLAACGQYIHIAAISPTHIETRARDRRDQIAKPQFPAQQVRFTVEYCYQLSPPGTVARQYRAQGHDFRLAIWRRLMRGCRRRLHLDRRRQLWRAAPCCQPSCTHAHTSQRQAVRHALVVLLCVIHAPNRSRPGMPRRNRTIGRELAVTCGLQ